MQVRVNRKILENFSYVTVLQVFLLVAPLITYPYLVRVLGRELYGVVLTAQMLASYVSLIVDFGSNSVCAKHVSINRNDKSKLSEIVSSVLVVRCALFVLLFVIYYLVVFLVPSYREYTLLFVITYALALNDDLFPQFFFQGVEEMRYITIVNIVTKLVFILLTFVIVKAPDDYLWVPVLYALGYVIGGLYALYVIVHRFGIHFFIPPIPKMMVYVKDSSAIFATDLVCTIKDKFNYLLVGSFLGMSSVVIYDLGLKLNSILTKPTYILTTVMFPRIAKDRNISTVKKVLAISLFVAISLVLLVNIFLPFIVKFFLAEEIDYLPLRLFLIAPILLSISIVIYSGIFVAFGYNKYAFYSILVTTVVYLLALLFCWFAGLLNNSIHVFVIISLVSYFTEFLYRCIKGKYIIDRNVSNTSSII